MPFLFACQNASVPTPFEATIPKPVITTRRFFDIALLDIKQKPQFLFAGHSRSIKALILSRPHRKRNLREDL
jgi:hypothetical protein